jgi:putative PIN family toxin of toxin-antitoxin system
MSERHRVVFDCNVFVQALTSPGGPAGACFNLAASGQCQLFVSPEVVSELREVTSRPKLVAKFGLNVPRVEEFIEAVVIAATLLEGVVESFTYARDPDDAHYVDLALAANAKLIVSRDKDLLDLMKASTPEAKSLMLEHPEFRVLTPPQFLEVVRQSKPQV